MRNILVSMFVMLASVFGAQPALAADLLTKASVTPVAAYNWTGWYFGGNIGYGWSKLPDPSLSYADPAALVGFGNYFAAGGDVTPNLKPRGAVGGGQIGFNWTITPNWVAGLVADFQDSDIRAAGTNTVTPPVSVMTNQSNSEHVDWFGTVRAKLGFVHDDWLILCVWWFGVWRCDDIRQLRRGCRTFKFRRFEQHNKSRLGGGRRLRLRFNFTLDRRCRVSLR